MCLKGMGCKYVKDGGVEGEEEEEEEEENVEKQFFGYV